MRNVFVGDLIQIEALNKLCKLVTKNGVGLNNVVTHVTIMEAPDFHEWVTGGEFVLTTWYAFSLDPSIQVECFRKLAQNISAIGIKTGRFIKKIPPEIIAIAEENNVAVFEVIIQSKFREIVQIISSEIQNYQTNLLVYVGAYYQKLMQLSIGSDDVLPLLDALYKHINLTCFCLDSRYEVLAYKLDRSSSKNEILQYADEIKAACSKLNDSELIYVELENMHIFKCQGSISFLGTLVIISDAKLSERIHLMCQQTAAFISLKLRDNYESKQKEFANLWSRFINEQYNDNLGEFVAELKYFGLTESDGYTMLLLDNKDESYKIARIIEMRACSLISFAYADKLILLIAGEKYSDEDSIWVEHVNSYFHKECKYELLVKAPQIQNISQLLDAYTIAKDAYKFLRIYNFTGIRSANDYVLMSMLMKNINTPEYKYLQKHIIVPLQAYDEKQKADLMKTLITAVFSNTLEAAAKKMHVHINTLRYRLNKVEEITGKNFFDVSDRYAIMIACLLYIGEQ